MVIVCNTCCNMTKTHFVPTVYLYYISSGFCKQSLFPWKTLEIGFVMNMGCFCWEVRNIPWNIIQNSFGFQKFCSSFYYEILKKNESRKVMIFLICLLRRAIKPSGNYRNSTFSEYSLNTFAYCLGHILSQVLLTF